MRVLGEEGFGTFFYSCILMTYDDEVHLDSA